MEEEMPANKPKLVIGRTDVNTFKFSLKMENASLAGEVSISLSGSRADQRTADDKRKLLFQRFGALAAAFTEAVKEESNASRA
jgi:hypothetical protein